MSAAAAAEPEALLGVAVDAAREAGGLLAERFARGREHDVGSKSTPTDLVSEADLASQRAIRERLSRLRPEDGFLGEEGGDEPGTSGLRWVVDPLDGTVNFVLRIPQWCVTIAVADEAGPVAGAVYDPTRDELFTAWRGGGPPRLNGEQVAAAEPTELAMTMVATGFGYDARMRAAQADVLLGLIARVRDIRRFGSAALDLAWTAAGRYGAYFERGVKPWDLAAGTLLCETAGLRVAELAERPDLPWGILVAREGVLEELLAIVG